MTVKGDLYFSNASLGVPWIGQDMELQGSLLSEGLKAEGEPLPAVKLKGLRAGGRVTLSGGLLGDTSLESAHIGLGLHLLSTQFAGEANFTIIQIGANLICEGISCKEVAFDGTEVKGGLFFMPDEKGNSCKVEGEVRFHGAQIDGTVSFKSVSFGNRVAFDGAEIKGNLSFGRDKEGRLCEVKGETRFLGTHIIGQASFIGVSFKDVSFDGTEVKGGLFFMPDEKGNSCKVEGEARFLCAQIGGQANFVGVSFNNAYFIASNIDEAIFNGVDIKDIFFDVATIRGRLFFRPDDRGNPCKIKGKARFYGTHIGREVNFRRVEIVSEEDCIFDHAHIGGPANFEGVSFANGVVFDGTEISGHLFFGPAGDGKPCKVGGEVRLLGARISGQANFLMVKFAKKRE
jgi:uncharacterized protein YjbI with pentapeptide repeats